MYDLLLEVENRPGLLVIANGPMGRRGLSCETTHTFTLQVDPGLRCRIPTPEDSQHNSMVRRLAEQLTSPPCLFGYVSILPGRQYTSPKIPVILTGRVPSGVRSWRATIV